MAEKKPPAPKIIQVMTTDHGRLVGVLYANGRVFFWTYTKLPEGKGAGEGFWAEMAYPDLNTK
jgi:hypothetical protein